MRDVPWRESDVLDLVDGAHIRWAAGRAFVVEFSGLTYWEQRAKAHDSGNPEVMLDAIQLDMAIDRMTDMPAKAALHLKLAGWDFANIGAVVRDRRRRTGAQLVADGVQQVARYERQRSGR